MKKEEAKRDAARARLDKASMWLDILTKGLGHAMIDGGYRFYEDETESPFFEIVDGPLRDAMVEYQLAMAAYRPYRRRFRMRRSSVRYIRRKSQASVVVKSNKKTKPVTVN